MISKKLPKVRFTVPTKLMREFQAKVPSELQGVYIADSMRQAIDEADRKNGVWYNASKHFKQKTRKTAAQLIREDRASH